MQEYKVQIRKNSTNILPFKFFLCRVVKVELYSGEVTTTLLPRPNGSASSMIMKPQHKLSSLSALSSLVNNFHGIWCFWTPVGLKTQAVITIGGVITGE